MELINRESAIRLVESLRVRCDTNNIDDYSALIKETMSTLPYFNCEDVGASITLDNEFIIMQPEEVVNDIVKSKTIYMLGEQLWNYSNHITREDARLNQRTFEARAKVIINPYQV